MYVAEGVDIRSMLGKENGVLGIGASSLQLGLGNPAPASELQSWASHLKGRIKRYRKIWKRRHSRKAKAAYVWLKRLRSVILNELHGKYKTYETVKKAAEYTRGIAHQLDKHHIYKERDFAYKVYRHFAERLQKEFRKSSVGAQIDIQCKRCFSWMPADECRKLLQRALLGKATPQPTAGPSPLSGVGMSFLSSPKAPMVGHIELPLGGVVSVRDWIDTLGDAMGQVATTDMAKYEEARKMLEEALKEKEFRRLYPVFAGGLLTVAMWKCIHPEAGDLTEEEKEALHNWAKAMTAVGEFEKTWNYAFQLFYGIPVTGEGLAEVAMWKMANKITMSQEEMRQYHLYKKRKRRLHKKRRWQKIATIAAAAAAAVAAVALIPGAAAAVWSVVKAVGVGIAKAATWVANAIYTGVKGAIGIVYKGGKWVYDSIIRPLFVGADGKAGGALSKVKKAADALGVTKKLKKKAKEKTLDWMKVAAAAAAGYAAMKGATRKAVDKGWVSAKMRTAGAVKGVPRLPAPDRLVPQDTGITKPPTEPKTIREIKPTGISPFMLLAPAVAAVGMMMAMKR